MQLPFDVQSVGSHVGVNAMQALVLFSDSFKRSDDLLNPTFKHCTVAMPNVQELTISRLSAIAGSTWSDIGQFTLLESLIIHNIHRIEDAEFDWSPPPTLETIRLLKVKGAITDSFLGHLTNSLEESPCWKHFKRVEVSAGDIALQIPAYSFNGIERVHVMQEHTETWLDHIIRYVY